jgi:hypothetical protein
MARITALRFVEAFLVFELGDGVGDDAGAGLDVALAADGEHGADGDAGVEVAGEVGVEDCAAVGAAAVGSSSSMISMARTLGAPESVPAGKQARRASTAVSSGLSGLRWC